MQEKSPKEALEASQKREGKRGYLRPWEAGLIVTIVSADVCVCVCAHACSYVPASSCHFVGWEGADPVSTMDTHSLQMQEVASFVAPFLRPPRSRHWA